MEYPERSEEKLEWIYATKGNCQLEERYDTWALDYDADLATYGYRMPAVVVGLIVRHIAADEGPLLDAGSGTGVLGESLRVLGYRDLTAIDLSKGMLAVARAKGVYREVRRMTLGEHLDFPDGQFAGVVAMGVLTVGHGPPSSLDELVRITRPGGALIFSMIHNDPVEREFRAKQEDLERRGRWRLVSVTEPFQSLPYGEPDITHRVFVYRVN